MKAIKFFSILFIATTTFFACKKEKDDQPKPFVFEGIWTGKIGTGSATPNSQLKFNAKAGGIMERINSSGNVSGTGNWALVENDFATSYKLTSGTQIFMSGTFDPQAKKLSGTWSNGSETGNWFATKE